MFTCYSMAVECLGCFLFVVKKYSVGLQSFLCISDCFLRTGSQKWDDQLEKIEQYVSLFLQLRNNTLGSAFKVTQLSILPQSLGLSLGKGCNFSELRLTSLQLSNVPYTCTLGPTLFTNIAPLSLLHHQCFTLRLLIPISTQVRCNVPNLKRTKQTKPCFDLCPPARHCLFLCCPMQQNSRKK